MKVTYSKKLQIIPQGFRLARLWLFNFSKFCFLTALLVRKIGNHQMVMTTPKIPTIKLFTLISLMAFCRSLVVAFVTALSVALVMTIKKDGFD